jgi:hypothetical protein
MKLSRRLPQPPVERSDKRAKNNPKLGT